MFILIAEIPCDYHDIYKLPQNNIVLLTTLFLLCVSFYVDLIWVWYYVHETNNTSAIQCLFFVVYYHDRLLYRESLINPDFLGLSPDCVSIVVQASWGISLNHLPLTRC